MYIYIYIVYIHYIHCLLNRYKGGQQISQKDDFLNIYQRIVAQGGRRVSENQRTTEKVIILTRRTKIRKTICFEMWGDFLKNWRAQRLDVKCGIIKKSDKQLYNK